MWPRLLNSIFELSSSSPVGMVNILNIILAPIPVSESINPLLINLSTSAFTPDKTNSNEPTGLGNPSKVIRSSLSRVKPPSPCKNVPLRKDLIYQETSGQLQKELNSSYFLHICQDGPLLNFQAT